MSDAQHCTLAAGDIATWLSAVGTFVAVGWGVFQVQLDRKRKRKEQVDAIHEIASASEKVASVWDEIADQTARDVASLSLDGRRWDSEADIAADTLDRLLNRDDLTDGTVRCGVAARQLALRIVSELAYKQPDRPNGVVMAQQLSLLQLRAQDVLEQARKLRKSHGIAGPRTPRVFVVLKEPSVT